MIKKMQIPLLLLLLVGYISGCATLTKEAPEQCSPYNVEEIQGKLKVGMTIDSLEKIVGSAPELLDNGAAKFKLKNGDLWVRCLTDGEKLKQVIFWGTIIRLPDGTTIKKTSKDQVIKKILKNPICIDVSINTQFNGEKRTGKCYYEQYGPESIVVEASEKGNRTKKVSLVLVNGKYLLQKGDIPAGNEFKYLAGYMANLQLLQRLVGRGMKEATPVENGIRNFKFSSDKEPFVIKILNKKMVYPAPWDVKGFVEPIKGKKGFNFNIDFKVSWGNSPNAKIQKTEFSGFFRQKEKIFGKDIIILEWKQLLMTGKGDLKPLKNPFGSFEEMQK
jgi:hypothetical protein